MHQAHQQGVGQHGIGIGALASLPAQAAEPEVYTGVVLEWTGNLELQSAPPAGGSNYFSAGVSDGSESTYLASDGDVAIVQLSSAGVESPASYATRAAHVSGGGQAAQIVRLSDGRAELAADGSAVIAWEGSFSVNFYGGLVPFTVTDPVLTVAADGTGTLRADLAGYSSSLANPEEKTPVAPMADVTMSTFDGVTIDTAS